MINKSRPIIRHPSPEPVSRSRKPEQPDALIEELQKQSISQSLADSFPDWDLNPPNRLVRRRKTPFR
jgi:hypothetical protein